MQLHHYTALNQLAEVTLGSDDAAEVLEAMARIVGGVLQVDRSLVYVVLLEEGVTTCSAEWLRPGVPGLAPSRGTYPLAVFGDAAGLMFRDRSIVTSDRSSPHPAIGPDGWRLLHQGLGIGSLLWHPFNFRADRFHLLAFNQVEERRWTPEEVEFVRSVARQVNLALLKLDLTAERQANLGALAASEARYRTLYDLTPSMFFTLDDQFRIVAANRFALEQLGQTEASVVGRSVPEGLLTGSVEEVRRELERCREELGRVYRWEGQSVRADGSTMTSRQTVRGGPGPDGRVLLFIEAEDITEQKKTEQALLQAQKLETLGVLVGTIAHDFNNLLGTIAGNTELALLRLPPESPARGPVENATTAATRAAELVKQLLSYSAKAPVVREGIDLNAMVRETLRLLEVTIGRRARLTLRLEPGLPPVVGDGVQLRQVLMNLVHNAADAVDGVDGEILIQTRLTDLHPAEVQLSVADNGGGIPAEDQRRIFDPFFTTKLAGRGLGLSAVRAIADRHGGRIEVDSQVGRGSTFRLILPAAPGHPTPDPGAPSAPVAEDRAAPSGSTVLVVDDEAALLEVLGSFLHTFGARALAAAGVAEAIAAVEAHPEIDCVLLDLTMPKGGGAVLAREIRARRPDLPMVLMSGFAQSDVTAELSGLLDAVLFKPFTPRELRRTLERVLGGAAPE